MAKLDRAVEVLAARGRNPGVNEVLVQAIEDLLRRRDPVEKAVRAQKIAERRTAEKSESTAPAQSESLNKKPESSTLPPAPAQSAKRTSVPSLVRHQVWLRDNGQCTWQHPDGKRCGERKMLELDHLRMVCRGGRASSR